MSRSNGAPLPPTTLELCTRTKATASARLVALPAERFTLNEPRALLPVELPDAAVTGLRYDLTAFEELVASRSSQNSKLVGELALTDWKPWKLVRTT